MKNRVVYYGDSFISDKASPEMLQFPLEEAWPKLLADKLGLEGVNCSRDGVGFDYIVTQFTYMAIDDEINSDDLIILGTSSWDRKWMVRDHPGASHLVNLTYDTFKSCILKDCHPSERPAITKQMEIAADYYIHSWNGPAAFVEQIAYLNHIRSISKELNLDVLILPTFEHYLIDSSYNQFVSHNTNYQVSGFLNRTSMNEFAGSDLDERYALREKFFNTEWNAGYDIRPNHFSVENHHILVDKLCDTITNNTPLNLSEGFVEDIYK